MADPIPLRPDVLVLAGGGIVGEAWMHGVLAGIEDAAGVDMTRVEAYVGTSAGSIVAARLAGGRRPPRPQNGSRAIVQEAAGDGRADVGDGSPLRGLVRGAARAGFAAGAPVAGAALAAGAPAINLARAAVLARAAPHGRSLHDLRRRVERWDIRFDGRLRVCAVDRGNGRRVVFGAPGAPPASVPAAVCASCAIPWVFSPVPIGGREYVDGGAWSVTNLDAAPAGRGTHVLCLDPAAGLGGEDRRLTALRGAFRAASARALQAQRRRGARVAHVWPDAGAAEARGRNLMAPRRTAGALGAGYRQGLALGVSAGV
jgi:NTE family protein